MIKPVNSYSNRRQFSNNQNIPDHINRNPEDIDADLRNNDRSR